MTIPKKSLDERRPIGTFAVASGTSRPSKADSANRAGSGHGGSGRAPDVRDSPEPRTKNAPEDETDLMPRSVFCFQTLMRDNSHKETSRIMNALTTPPRYPRPRGKSQPSPVEQPRHVVPALHRPSRRRSPRSASAARSARRTFASPASVAIRSSINLASEAPKTVRHRASGKAVRGVDALSSTGVSPCSERAPNPMFYGRRGATSLRGFATSRKARAEGRPRATAGSFAAHPPGSAATPRPACRG